MFQTFISRHNSNFFSDKLVLTSVTPASSAPVLQTPKATSSTRSEERFSRNAETDLVCRLLLEKKKGIAGFGVLLDLPHLGGQVRHSMAQQSAQMAETVRRQRRVALH